MATKAAEEAAATAGAKGSKPAKGAATAGASESEANAAAGKAKKGSSSPKRKRTDNSSGGKPKKPRKRRTGGAAAILEGWWKLDLEKSNTMEHYLGSMGLNETAIQAALKGERDLPTLQHFKVTATSVTIERRSRMGNNTTKLMYNRPLQSNMSTGLKTMTAARQPNGVIQITTKMPLKTGIVTITDTRSVQNDVMHQILRTEGEGASSTTETKRFYNRCEDPGPLPSKK